MTTRREPMRKVGANEETFPGGSKSTIRVYLTRTKAPPMKKVDKEAEA
jgi:hypothetical protein